MDKNGYTSDDIGANSVWDELDTIIMETHLQTVYDALCEKGYNPIAQIIGYLLSEDPIYITSHNNARSIMSKLDRHDILRIMLQHYFDHNGND